MNDATLEEQLQRGSLSNIGAAIRAKEISIRETVGWYLARIDALNSAGPMLNAVRAVSSKAGEDAKRLDEELQAGHDRGPLHGIPVLLKDNIMTADGLSATGGAAALCDFVPRREATLVRLLRDAGAIVLGKTNMTEFADYVSDVMPSEFSGAGGVVRNPHGQRYGRGQGSSVGSAAAVAAGFAPIAIGSETQNSIQTPCCHSSVVGFKPSVGTVSRTGMIPLVPSQDSPGPIARSLQDAALVFAAIEGADSRDTATFAASVGERAASPVSIAGVRIGVPRCAIASRPDYSGVLAAFEDVLSRLSRAGAIIVDACDLPSAEQLQEVRSSVFPTEFKAALDAFLEEHGAPCGIVSLADLVRWNEKHPEFIPYGQSLLVAARGTNGLRDVRYRSDRARDLALSRTAGIDAALEQSGANVLIAPMGAAAKCTGKAGAPVVALPAGLDAAGAPFGVTLFTSFRNDMRLLKVAEAVEHVVGERRLPAL